MHTFDYALVDFFHIDRILRVGGVAVLDDANMPSVRKVCRYIVTNRSYSVFRCLIPRDHGVSVRTRVARTLRGVAGGARRMLKPELAEFDAELGLVPGSRCIAFKKESEDTRQWDFHRVF